MGGSGSGRWNWHNKRATVESCRRFTVGQVLRPGLWLGRLSWTQGDKPSGNITYRVHYEDNQPRRLQLMYTVTNTVSGEKDDFDYSMPIVATFTPWGSPRYWLLCPDCGRRCGTLYQPGSRFICRLCGDLTYTTSQESHKSDFLAKLMGAEFTQRYSYLNLSFEEMGTYLECQVSGKRLPKRIDRKVCAGMAAMASAELEKLLEEIRNRPDPYADYLTPAAICERSGLSLAELAALNDSRLLVPDHGELYRPKLASWAGKLAYLLRAGWSLAELQAWARGRWSTPNPRAWPPEREAWQHV